MTNIYCINIESFTKFFTAWNVQIEGRRKKISAKLAAMAQQIAGPVCVEQAETETLENEFANRMDDLDDFPAPTTLPDQAGGSTQAGDRPNDTSSWSAGETQAGDRPNTSSQSAAGDTQAGDSRPASSAGKNLKRPDPPVDTPAGANDAGSKRQKVSKGSLLL
jgi:hypothetical protein